MWSNGPIEDEFIEIPPFVDVFPERRGADDFRLKFACKDAMIYNYPYAIAIETKHGRVIVLQEYVLFHWGHLRLSKGSLAMLADFGLPIVAYCINSCRDELLKLASADALKMLPTPISREIIHQTLWKKYDGHTNIFYY